MTGFIPAILFDLKRCRNVAGANDRIARRRLGTRRQRLRHAWVTGAGIVVAELYSGAIDLRIGSVVSHVAGRRFGSRPRGCRATDLLFDSGQTGGREPS